MKGVNSVPVFSSVTDFSLKTIAVCIIFCSTAMRQALRPRAFISVARVCILKPALALSIEFFYFSSVVAIFAKDEDAKGWLIVLYNSLEHLFVMKVQHGFSIQWLVFGAASDKYSHWFIVVLGLNLPYLLLFDSDIGLLDGGEVLFSLPESGDYLRARFGKLLSSLLRLLLEVEHLVGEHDTIDFHLIGGWVAARGCFAHKW